mgnify:CR=1 FL=1
MNLDSKTKEAMDILQEECGEAVVAISKCRRFGMDDHCDLVRKKFIMRQIVDRNHFFCQRNPIRIIFGLFFPFREVDGPMQLVFVKVTL